VGKEFSVFEGDVKVPEHTGAPRLVGPVIGYGLQDYPAHLHVPFKVVDKQLLIDPDSTIASSENVAFFFSVMDVSKSLWEDGKVELRVSGLRPNEPSQKALTLSLKDYPYHEIMGIHHSFPARELSPDYYEMTLTVKDGDGSLLDESASNFIISPSEGISHPVTMTRSFPLSNYFLFVYSLANQYDRAGIPEKAHALYEKAFSLRPDYHAGIVEYVQFLQKNKEFAQSLALIEIIKGVDPFQFDYFLFKGKAYMGMEKYFMAIENFLEGNKIYDSDTRLLNSLGFCFYKTGDRKRALEVLQSSLSLNPEQEDIKALIQAVEKERDTT
jgi:tetratricopeptide (TPR) repeat protein